MREECFPAPDNSWGVCYYGGRRSVMESDEIALALINGPNAVVQNLLSEDRAAESARRQALADQGIDPMTGRKYE